MRETSKIPKRIHVLLAKIHQLHLEEAKDAAALARIRLEALQVSLRRVFVLLDQQQKANDFQFESLGERIAFCSRVFAEGDLGALYHSIEGWLTSTANMMIASYCDKIDGLSSSSLRARDILGPYVMGHEVRVRETQTIQTTLRAILEPVTKIAYKGSQLMPSLKQDAQTLLENDKTDWGHVARSAMSGAMAVFNPLLGIPMAIASMAQGSKADSMQERVGERYWQMWGEYLDILVEAEETFSTLLEPIEKYVHEKFQKANEAIFSHVLPAIIGHEKVITIYRDTVSTNLQSIAREMEAEANGQS